MDRREFLKAGGLVALLPASFVPSVLARSHSSGLLVNDVHSKLNVTRVRNVISPGSPSDLMAAIRKTRRNGGKISVCGGRHAMGGQQFGSDTTLLDLRAMKRVIALDRKRGIVEVEAGIEWPDLMDQLADRQHNSSDSWGIAQKQTGADRLTIGGALAANVHGRGLKFKPFIQDVEWFDLNTPAGESLRCSRTENQELFALAIGGYGLFGVISAIGLRLIPRQKVERVVEISDIRNLMAKFDERIASGFLYGDFQFAIDNQSEDFMRAGVFACYRAVDPSTALSAEQRELSREDWVGLLSLAHTDKKNAFERYAAYYRSTNGQVYWADTQQLGFYPDDYHRDIDRRARARVSSSEMITEIYVPRETLASFMEEAREDFRRNAVELIYGTVRLIERDDESFLAWAKQPYACVIFNLHAVHTPQGLLHSSMAFRRLIDMAIARKGSYYLTYHRYARRDQVEACYPQFSSFIDRKKQLDPSGLIRSDWFTHYERMFAS